MAFWWNCTRCGKFNVVDSSEDYTILELNQDHEVTSKIYLCESCKKSFDEWIHDKKPHYARYEGSLYKCIYVDKTSVFADKMERCSSIDISKRDKVLVGDVYPLPASNLTDKEFPKKVLEEAAEVYSAWENYQALEYPCDEEDEAESLYRIIEECCDVIQTASNLIWAAGKEVDLLRFGQSHADKTNRVDVEPILREIMMRNVKKGRYDV